MDPIFEQLAGELLFTPDPPPPPSRGVEEPHQLPAVQAAPLLERIDGWCEDRPQHALSDEDGQD